MQFFGDLADLAEPRTFARQIETLRKTSWIVYAKPPFGSPEQVLGYLGRYTHRVAIANSRLVAVDDTSVRFRWRDYRQQGKVRVMALEPDEFIRRFLLHSLPTGFHRIRHYGFLANGCRKAGLALIRSLLAQPASEPVARDGNYRDRLRALFGVDLDRRPCCGGLMRIVDTLPRPPPAARAPP